MAKIGLIDADLIDGGTRHPNLVVMKLAGYHKDLGDEVELILDGYDRLNDYDYVYVSKVFTFTKIPVNLDEYKNVSYGGTGFFVDGGKSLPKEIEHHKPYYDIYKTYVEKQLLLGKKKSDFSDYLDFSIGFTTRGCFRKCDFCVNKKYDHVFRHSPVSEFLDKSRKKIYLWDDNILAFTKWEEVIDELVATGKPFQFRQGIDLRLMTDKKAFKFNNVKYYGDFIFAFDHIEDKDLIIEKIQLWKKYSNKIPKLYVIVGYASQDEKDVFDTLERISILMRYGSLPYIMRHENYNKSPYRSLYIQLARWCNQPNIFKKMSFREFCEANQRTKIDQSTLCSSMEALKAFEKEYPRVAKKYFDEKFIDRNIYNYSLGEGKIFCNKQNCELCKKNTNDFKSIMQEKNYNKLVVQLLTKVSNSACLNYDNAICMNNEKTIVKVFIDSLMKLSIVEIKKMLINNKNIINYTEKDCCMEFISADEIVKFINEKGIKENYFGEYTGEEIKTKFINHFYLLSLCNIGLISVFKYKHLTQIRSTEVLNHILNMDEEKQIDIIKRLVFSNPILISDLRNECWQEYIERCAFTMPEQKRAKKSVLHSYKIIEGYVDE